MGCKKLSYYEEEVQGNLRFFYGGALEKKGYAEKNCKSALRFGFNGQEKDNEIKGIGNSLSFKYRIYDSRLGKWLSTDNVMKPNLSQYQFGSNNPIFYIDPDGNDEYSFHSNGTWSVVRKKGVDVFKKQDVKNGVYRVLQSTLPDNFSAKMIGQFDDLDFIAQYSIDNSSFNKDINSHQGSGDVLDAHNELALYAWGYTIVAAYDKALDIMSLGTKRKAVKEGVQMLEKNADELIKAADKATKGVGEAFKKATSKRGRLYKLYKVVDAKTGEVLKYGHTTMKKITDRYSKAYLKGKKMIQMDKGSAEKILKKESDLIKTKPGPHNKETWRGTGG